MSAASYVRDLWEGKRTGLDAKILLPLLAVCSLPYRVLTNLRELAYRKGLLETLQLPKPVICVGNITVGGTGKTPVVALIARYFLDRGKRVCVLSRGYRGNSERKIAIVSDGCSMMMTPAEAGDEPCMLAEKLPGLIVVVGADRYSAGLYAMEHLHPDLFILDDGFQHLRLHRDLNILLLDSTRPYGNGHVLPAGLLREPKSAAKRADVIIYTRAQEEALPGFSNKLTCLASHNLAGVVRHGMAGMEPLSNLRQSKGVAFAGIADPSSFFSMLHAAGLNICAELRFPDHCTYHDKEITEITASVKSTRADYVITTEKDMVKLGRYVMQLDPLYAAVLEVTIRGTEPLEHSLEKLLYS